MSFEVYIVCIIVTRSLYVYCYLVIYERFINISLCRLGKGQGHSEVNLLKHNTINKITTETCSTK